MSKTMLIDAAHAEETRVVVTDGSRVEEFDFESQGRKQLRGNIYLAKVTRVEPSLQAAFIEYGGNRHGFLAFSEIHPDYYQIPQADREALMREEAEDQEEVAEEASGDDEAAEADADDEDVAEEQAARRRRRLLRRYKIQEVIKRRQVMLVQVVKEERGNKGAALTTYLSIAGRYSVLMPNTPRGGGISRKITTASDRKRLKTIVQGLELPEGMGLIIRTAGAKRTKAEIQRDYEYLMRAWETVRETTMTSIAPSLIYAEEDLVKRAIRDMFEKEMDGIIVDGEKGYRDARDFLRMLMPSQVRKITQHKDGPPLFVARGIEEQLSQIYTPVVPLKSGGYLVINQTEALVAIDVNSGKSTRERNIETTALKTNLEAADEACRQLRLRDLAGLIVIDFIDMDESKNNRAVEKRMKDALALDRARVQNGKISMFGLMELSRQRRRTGVLEGTTQPCEHCGGMGRVRTAQSSALAALRAVEMEAVKSGAGDVTLRVPRGAGLYILNEKRAYLEHLRATLGLFVTVLIDDEIGDSEFAVERTSHSADFRPTKAAPQPADEDEEDFPEEDEEDEEEVRDEEEVQDDEAEAQTQASPAEDSEDGQVRRRRRRRRGGRGPEGRGPETPPQRAETEDEDSESRRRRRRGRRGGRRGREEARGDEPYAWVRMRAPDGEPYLWLDPADVVGPREGGPEPRLQPATPESGPAPATAAGEAEIWVELPAKSDGATTKSARGRRGRGRRSGAEASAPSAPPPELEAANDEADAAAPPSPEAEEKAPRKTSRPRGGAKAKEQIQVAPAPEAAGAAEAEPAPGPQPKPKSKPKPKPKPVAAKPATPAEPDPAEIKAPPEKPKTGWWRARR